MPLQQKDYAYEEDYYVSPVPSTQKLRTVAKKRKRRPVLLNKALRSRCQALFILVTVLAMAVTIRSGISASRGYALIATQQQAIELEQENERLRVEIAHLKAPGRIKDKAAADLGMKIPSNLYFDIENSMAQ